VLPGVTVTITHTGTGDVRTQVTSNTGDYAFNLLPGGTYLVRSELQGFKAQEARVTVAAGDRARMDARLEIGSITESVQVTAEAVVLQTDTSTVGALITTKVVEDIPVAERNLTRLIQLVPGATDGPVSSSVNGTRPDERRQTAAVSINGAGDLENNSMIDGADNNERLMGTVGIRVSMDASPRSRSRPASTPPSRGARRAASSTSSPSPEPTNCAAARTSTRGAAASTRGRS
jgi:hypothetical protein